MGKDCFSQDGKMFVAFTKDELALLHDICRKANRDFKNVLTTLELLKGVEAKISQADLEAYILKLS